MSDEAFHEIQLNGKQLVFLFMAATVVAVVIFLCGVMVGRGVRAQQGEGAEYSAEAAEPALDEVPQAPSAAAAATANASSTAQEELSYPERLGAQDAPPETLKEQAPADSPATAPAPAAAVEVASSSPVEPGGEGYAVQVAALRERREAEAIVKRLASKGYGAYVMAPAAGAPGVYRVRVGKFGERREAERIAARLEKEEQFKPWVVR